MAVTTEEILAKAKEVGDLVAQHPAVTRYKEAQRAVTSDAEAGRLLQEFDREIDTLGRQEQSGVPITEQQQMRLQQLQGRIVSHIKIKALNLAQVEFYDLLRKVTQTVHRPLTEGLNPAGAAGAPQMAGSGAGLGLGQSF